MFDLQNHVTSSIVGAIALKLQGAQIKRKPTENLVAYDYYLCGLAKAQRPIVEANGHAIWLFCRAIALDSRLGCAYGMAAWC
jgi:hypothetical protein